MRIATGPRKNSLAWKTKDISWEELLDILRKPVRTQETSAEYRNMSRTEKAAVKDVGGFVGGALRGSRRKKAEVLSRSLITLDADYADPDLWEHAVNVCDYTLCMYSTHSSLPKAPRYRLVIPLDKEIEPNQYEPVARHLASLFGIEQFDTTTYETHRLMFWPSVPKDVEYVFKERKGNPVKAKAILKLFDNWRDCSNWPYADREEVAIRNEAKRQADPTTKDGIVGAFCRCYTVPEAIEAFLRDEYDPCGDGRRYTYMLGSTAAGAVLYEDDKFLYSYHESDPCCGKLCNAYDLVRLHKFGARDGDKGLEKEASGKALPSMIAMRNFASADSRVRALSLKEGLTKAQEVFGSIPQNDFGEQDEAESTLEEEPNKRYNEKRFEVDKTGKALNTVTNIAILMLNDAELKDCIAYDELAGDIRIIKPAPWDKNENLVKKRRFVDSDFAYLLSRLERVGNFTPNCVRLAIDLVAQENAYHPIRDYLKALKWDGVPRVETLFIDVLKAEDTEYTRLATKVWLTGAVKRVMEPGCQFDYSIILAGGQGAGKTSVCRMLGLGWAYTTIRTFSGKEACEALAGNWIVEIEELEALRRSELETIKGFLTRTEDDYRGAYKKFKDNRPRQCVFIGTTNEDKFLGDSTGERRFWPISVYGKEESSWERLAAFTPEIRDQVWAEALTLYQQDTELLDMAKVTQLVTDVRAGFKTDTPSLGLVEEYLEKRLPNDWYTWHKTLRKDFAQGLLSPDAELDESNSFIRNTVSALELSYELFKEENPTNRIVRTCHEILRNLEGWEKKRNRVSISGYGRQYVYVRSGCKEPFTGGERS